MSRVLLVSMGVPAYVASRRHGGPGLRAEHFARALSRAGVRVLAVCVCSAADRVALGNAAADGPDDQVALGNAAIDGPEGVETLLVEERALAAAGSKTASKDRAQTVREDPLRRRIEAFAPDAVVGVTVYAAALALRLGLDLPLWADVFGDLLCEAQAKAAVNGSDWSLVHFWTLLRPVLEHADRFSAVSQAQSHALVGQLGIAGRLSARTAGEELVTVIPCAAEACSVAPSRVQARRQLGLPDDAFVLLWSGGFNTWCDVDTVAAAVAAALADNPALHLVVSGGAIAGHDEQSFGRFRRCLDDSIERGAASCRENSRARVHMLGWLPSQQLPLLYAACDLGLNIERPLYERRLGAENRVAQWQANGLACLTTALSESGARSVRSGLAWQAPVAAPAALAARIGELCASPSLVSAGGQRAREAASRELGFDATAASLCQWCLAPVRAGDYGVDRLVRLGLLSHPEASAEMLEAYVRELPLSQLLRRGLRWTLRRAVKGAGFRSNGRGW